MVIPNKVVQSMSSSGHGKHMQTKSKNNWRRRKFPRRNDMMWNQGVVNHNGAYEPPRLSELQQQNRLKTRRFYPRKSRAPRAPRNTTSFIMRAKKSGGLASLVSPVTPAILPTPVLSPAPRYREGLVDEVNKEWGVDGYGSMNGLIRLRAFDEGVTDDWACNCESESDVEQDPHAQSVQQLEQRIDHGLSRFEILYPKPYTPAGSQQLLEVKMEELENRVAQLEDENLSLKENLYLLGQELADSQRRLRSQDGGEFGSDDNAEICSERSGGEASCAQN